MRLSVLSLVLLFAPCLLAATPPPRSIGDDRVEATIASLTAKFGEAQAARIRLGVRQVADRWWPTDGDAEAFAAFCADNFVADEGALAGEFARLERVLEQVAGHLHVVRRELLTPQDLDTGPVGRVDSLMAAFDLGSHLSDDLFAAKVAHFALLNFPVHSLADRLAAGSTWDRAAWARSRLMDSFAERVPADVAQEATRALTAADRYIAEYNIRMDRLIAPDGSRPFPAGLRLVTHWGLRDELASHYGEKDALVKQRMIQKVMERIVRQEIPRVVIDNPTADWAPESNSVVLAPGAKALADLEREPDTRYAVWLANFRALRRADPYCPATPSVIARSFESGRQIPEKEVEALLTTVLAAPEVRQLGALIARRLGRPLEPFDIWYPGFKARSGRSEEELDRLVRSKYPTVAAFQADLPRILRDLGFAPERAAWLAARIVVDPSRGVGHAMGAAMRGDQAHLRTRIPPEGMNYKGYNIAIHELGHNVEQVLSLDGIDHWLLSGVPNNAFTEALAYSFQNRDLELLGLGGPDRDARATAALGALWATYEIGAVALVDMKVWRWLYAHPEATPAELKQAVLAAAREVWNAYFAPVLGRPGYMEPVPGRDACDLLAVYSHMVSYPLYLSDYAIGHIIDFQISEKLTGPAFGAEFERMARQGRVTPDGWMKGAVGTPISAEALLAAARAALADEESREARREVRIDVQ